MVEMLVVIGIILLLLSILLPAINGIYKQAMRTRTQMDLTAIGQALDAYKADFGSYPMSLSTDTSETEKPRLLAVALIGPGDDDGAAGPGFRVIPGGAYHMPYIAVDRFKLSLSGTQWDMLDRFKQPIRYFPKYKTTASLLVGKCPGQDAMYDYRDAAGLPADLGQQRALRVFLGDTNWNNMIEGAEKMNYAGGYILWSAGPDKVFQTFTGSESATQLRLLLPKCDDVLNFEFR